MPPPDISFEYDRKPAPGETLELEHGIHWLRMPLPFALDHINLWLLHDAPCWDIVDTGLGTEKTISIWQRLMQTLMKGESVRHLLVTHLHPDHAGCAGWLSEHCQVDLSMTQDEYLLCRVLAADTGKPVPERALAFYRAAGYTAEQLENYTQRFGMFGRAITPLPPSYSRLMAGQQRQIGAHTWQVLIGRGHSPEHACFFCDDLNVLISGDQVLPSISANVSVFPTQPDANPLDDWFRTLQEIKDAIPEDVLVLPAHGKPFRGAHARIDTLIGDHYKQLENLYDHLQSPCRVIDAFAALFRGKVRADNLMLATGEAIAHLHFLMAAGEISKRRDENGVDWYQQS